jgi:hypothetical protein
MRGALLKFGLILLCSVRCEGDHRGISLYGIQNKAWPCAASLREARRNRPPAISMVWSSLGAQTNCLKRFLRRPGRKVLQIQVSNACCQRRGDCQRYEMLHGWSLADWRRAVDNDDPRARRAFRKYARPAAALIKDARRLKCLIAPELESNLTAPEQGRLIEWIRDLFPPRCKFVSYRGLAPGASFVEYHGAVSRRHAPCIWSNDGTELSGCDLRNVAECEYSFLWHHRFNGWPDHGEPTDRRRQRTDWPTTETWEMVRQYLL